MHPLNLKVLQRHDPSVSSIISSATYVVLYHFVQDEWNKAGIEGPMFIYRRNVEPALGLTILNRFGPTNYSRPITAKTELDIQGKVIMMQEADEEEVDESKILGLWVHDDGEGEKLLQLLESLRDELVASGPPASSSTPPAPHPHPHVASPPPPPPVSTGPSTNPDGSLSFNEILARLQSPAVANAVPAGLSPVPPPAPPPAASSQPPNLLEALFSPLIASASPIVPTAAPQQASSAALPLPPLATTASTSSSSSSSFANQHPGATASPIPSHMLPQQHPRSSSSTRSRNSSPTASPVRQHASAAHQRQAPPHFLQPHILPGATITSTTFDALEPAGPSSPGTGSPRRAHAPPSNGGGRSTSSPRPPPSVVATLHTRQDAQAAAAIASPKPRNRPPANGIEDDPQRQMHFSESVLDPSDEKSGRGRRGRTTVPKEEVVREGLVDLVLSRKRSNGDDDDEEGKEKEEGPMEKREFVRHVLGLIHTDPDFVEKLYGRYLESAQDRGGG